MKHTDGKEKKIKRRLIEIVCNRKVSWRKEGKEGYKRQEDDISRIKIDKKLWKVSNKETNRKDKQVEGEIIEKKDN